MARWVEYELVRLYGKYMRQSGAYVSAQVSRARLDKAPDDVVHWFQGRWFRADDIKDPQTREALGLPPIGKEG